MHFSKKTENILICLIDGFEKYMNETVDVKKSRLNQIILSLYYDIIASHNLVNYVYKNITLNVKKHPQKKKKELFTSYYIPKDIVENIKETEKGSISYECSMKGHKICIHFIIFDENDYQNTQKYKEYIKKILTWLNMAFLCTSCVCSKILNIYIYPTTYKKVLPKKNINILSPENCNTAVTTGCIESSSIIIYRKEEWFKVFIHETFHSLGLDFATMSTEPFEHQLKTIFPLKITDLRLYESYTEFWANIMNCLFGAFYLLNHEESKPEKENKFLLYSYFCIQLEQFFSLFQCVKILKFMGLKYKHLYNTDNISIQCRNTLFKEKNTHIFSYYILKCIFLFYYCDFLDWCRQNNCNTFGFLKTKMNLNSLFFFIKNRYKQESFLKKLDDMKLFIVEKRENEPLICQELLKTMRMTICEWD